MPWVDPFSVPWYSQNFNPLKFVLFRDDLKKKIKFSDRGISGIAIKKFGGNFASKLNKHVHPCSLRIRSWFLICISTVSQLCFNCVSTVFQLCFNCVSTMFQLCLNCVSTVSLLYLNSVSSESQLCFNWNSTVFQLCLNCVSTVS